MHVPYSPLITITLRSIRLLFYSSLILTYRIYYFIHPDAKKRTLIYHTRLARFKTRAVCYLLQ